MRKHFAFTRKLFDFILSGHRKGMHLWERLVKAKAAACCCPTWPLPFPALVGEVVKHVRSDWCPRQGWFDPLARMGMSWGSPHGRELCGPQEKVSRSRNHTYLCLVPLQQERFLALSGCLVSTAAPQCLLACGKPQRSSGGCPCKHPERKVRGETKGGRQAAQTPPEMHQDGGHQLVAMLPVSYLPR